MPPLQNDIAQAGGKEGSYVRPPFEQSLKGTPSQEAEINNRLSG